MKKLFFLVIVTFLSLTEAHSSDGLRKITGTTSSQSDKAGSTKRFNIKFQPAIFWATLGIEAEYVVSPKISIALNMMGKLGRVDRRNNIYPIKQEEFLENGYMAELIGRYYISISKKKLTLAPMGFYIQAAVGFNKLLYFDGSTRPFTLHTRKRDSDDPRKPSDFDQPIPLVGGLGAGYQIDLAPKKVIANILIGTQTNFDDKGVFFLLYFSPSVGLMF